MGFRKIVQEKWEFQNENFKKGGKELLPQIRRRRIESPSPTLTVNAGNSGSPAAGQITPANSGGDLVSGSTSHPSLPKNSVIIDLAMVHRYEAISQEHERLKILYEQVCSELTESRIKCDELTGILLQQREVGPEMKSQSCGSNAGAVCLGDKGKSVNDGEENDDGDFKDVKIFGVMLEQEKKKRARDEIFDSRGGGSGNKERKTGEAEAAEGIKVGTS
uniref:HSF-type DNA-binding domain-containing protein n=1 Tax=Daucus carota subsp. sativus TaxID=79200 RepID=A0A164UB67_DAUCS